MIYAYFNHSAASFTVTDDVKNQATYKILNTNLLFCFYSNLIRNLALLACFKKIIDIIRWGSLSWTTVFGL